MRCIIPISHYAHKQFEKRALLVKIEKLHRWLEMYRDGKVGNFQNPIEIMILLQESENELKTFI